MGVETITIAEFHQRLRDQGVPHQEDLAFRCPMCGTVQSARTLICAGAGDDFNAVEKYLGFSCVGRFTNAGPPPREPYAVGAGIGCNWTLGGLFRLHRLAIVDENGDEHPRFEVASAEDAKALTANGGLIEGMVGRESAAA